MYDGCESGMAEQHDGRVTDKQPALILLHKAGYAGCPESLPSDILVWPGNPGRTSRSIPRTSQNPCTIPCRTRTRSLSKNNETMRHILLPFGLCIFGGKPARTFRVRAGLFRGVGAFVRKKLKVSATVLAFCMVNIHLCPEQNKKKMDDKTLKNSYLYTAYKPHVYPTWPTRFLYREFPLPSHLKHPAQTPAVSGNRMQF